MRAAPFASFAPTVAGRTDRVAPMAAVLPRGAVRSAPVLHLRLGLLLLAGVLCTAPRWAPAQGAPAPGATATTTMGAAAGSDFRPELKDALPQGQLVGKGRLTVWGFEVYDARLWAPAGFPRNGYASQPLALELDYLRAFDAVDVAERSIKEMRRSVPIDNVQAAAWTAEMLRVIPDVKKGDRILGVHQPGVGASFWVNGKPHGSIRDPEFARLFFGIWLSPKTSEPKLRDALLAGTGG